MTTLLHTVRSTGAEQERAMAGMNYNQLFPRKTSKLNASLDWRVFLLMQQGCPSPIQYYLPNNISWTLPVKKCANATVY